MPSLLQFTDTHLSIDPQGSLKGVNTRDSLSACVTLAQQQQACQILLTGDLSHDASQESYHALQEIITPLNLPVSALAGNHDILPEMQKFLPNDWTCGDCIVENWQVIMLNSAVPGKEHGFITDKEIKRAKAILTTTRQDHALICLHHQPVPVGSQWIDNIMLQNPDTLFDLIDSHEKVKGILFGHVHQNFRSKYNNITIIGSPSTCIQFQANSTNFGLDNIAPGFRLLHLHNNGQIDTELFYLDYIPELKPNEAY